jgi:hypothetical protein
MSDMKKILKERLEQEKKFDFKLTVNELLQFQSSLMSQWAMQQKDLYYYESEYNTPKKPYSMFSFGVHIKDIIGKEKQAHFKYSINNTRQKIQETELLMKKLDYFVGTIIDVAD